MDEVTVIIKYDEEISDFKVCLINQVLDDYEKTKLALRLDCIDFFSDEKEPFEYNEIYFLTCPIFVNQKQIEDATMTEFVGDTET